VRKERMTKLAQLIAREEGFGRPGAIPTRRNNPGDLRHSPHSAHPGGPQHADDIGTIDTVEHGWEDLERQLGLIAKKHYLLTLEQFTAGERDSKGVVLPGGYPGWAPTADNNDPARYAAMLAAGLGLAPDALFVDAIKVKADGNPSPA